MAAIVTDWFGFRAAVLAAVEAAMPPAVLVTTAATWADGPRPYAGHHVLLSVVSAIFDDRDSALSRGGPQVLESMAVITVQVVAEATNDSGDTDALWLIEQLRLGLRKVSVRAELETAGIVIQVFPRSTRNIGGVADGHALSVHALEVTFCCTFALETTEDAGLVERVVLAGEVTDEAGDVTLDVDLSDLDPEPP
jgi:hypothetical protein